MDQPQGDTRVEDNDQNITTHPSGAEGAPASVDSTKENKDLLSDSIPEVEVSDELEKAGVTKEQPTSLRDDLQEHISKASDSAPKIAQPAQSNADAMLSSKKGDVGLGGTWIATLKEKFKGILSRSAKI